jgi:hypothetical protein
VIVVYGRQFYRAPTKEKVEFLNSQLDSGRFTSLEEIVQDMFIDLGEMQEELFKVGYAYVPYSHRFIRICQE